ncbi:MAG: adenylate/guanylate cyclase domain-containing protein, partial [Pikeienuella sp.]
AWGDKNAGFIDSQLAYLDEFSEQSGAVLAFANTVTDRDDGFVREYITRLEGTDKLSMSGHMAQLATGTTPPERGLIDWQIPEDLRTSVFQQLPADLIVKFGKIPPMRAKLKEWLKDRIVYVGADLEQRDRKLTPMSVGDGALQSIPGVTMQAHVLAQLIDGRVVNNASDELGWVLIAVMALVGVVLGLLKAPLVLRGGGFILTVVFYLGVMYFLAASEILFLPIASVMASLAVSFALGVGLDGFLTQRDEQFIRGAFSHYLDPAMVDELAENPDALRLGGDKREMSLIFTDIAGFTTMSEELEPEQLTKLLNGYFDGMTEIIFRHGGAVDKFIGDAVVAHFGAPTPLKNHSLYALRCAEELDRFAENYKRENAHLGLGVTRIGVHSGVATVGNFGGTTRFDYTAIGDSVNTAARLESSNKQYGTRIGVSQECAEMASARAEAGEELPLLQTIGLVMLKGKTRPVTVYTINTDEDEEFVWAYEAAFSLLEIDTSKARAAFDQLFRSTPSDPLVKFHITRLENGETGGVIQQTVK